MVKIIPMKVEVILNGHETIEGETAEAVVDAMSNYQWPDEHGKMPTGPEYMAAVSERVKTQKGAIVRSCCATHFLDDLAANGVIRRLT